MVDAYLLLGDFQGLQVVANDTEFLLKLDDFAGKLWKKQSISTEKMGYLRNNVTKYGEKRPDANIKYLRLFSR